MKNFNDVPLKRFYTKIFEKQCFIFCIFIDDVGLVPLFDWFLRLKFKIQRYCTRKKVRENKKSYATYLIDDTLVSLDLGTNVFFLEKKTFKMNLLNFNYSYIKIKIQKDKYQI
jgi:hypothetical protein